MKAVYPGSFDPITYGHIDLVERCSKIFDEVLVLVMENVNKKHFFSHEERIEMVRCGVSHLENVTIITYSGLLVDFAKANDVKIIIRGLRAVSDFELELQMAHANKAMLQELETLFLMTDTSNSFISSSMVREIAAFGGDISKWVPPCVQEEFRRKLGK
ncbi:MULTISPECIES: pantetheine-phosphate adenylyltransferase [Mesotoga]|jgi:pantetheine-phosphate adenylyltransferase|uniref:Phosphopantetheine adenylyltransferase n=1 Tax=Mesotoga prima MesG1.Ag.4.2 TaxID=660470 RepID=I2F1Y8_9BACT|nr:MULTISPECIES: pantetheine-phosphate adenylyltransferase [Mesotoga]AFK05941.1 pantetheine-phosphate adenylyltransferase [Mesotoga prima MesG1.Ag.4.2]PIJ63158.1 phosphopantetheine adenylyltransferase [Mesotoga sp. H07.pep.5.3]RLL88093.1 phosphopantetheine adenylyltransferase [Mesotoga sp. H07pep.5.4]RLL92260.1 phosphopantetheine adenylyltransferase [Mesotoga sp. HF07.pep.5.2.highcov]HQC15374.1 pantetheine-phosphate adenylyltransferase [Mesotoga prima]